MLLPAPFSPARMCVSPAYLEGNAFENSCWSPNDFDKLAALRSEDRAFGSTRHPFHREHCDSLGKLVFGLIAMTRGAVNSRKSLRCLALLTASLRPGATFADLCQSSGFTKNLKDKDVVNEVFLVKYSAVVRGEERKSHT